MYTTVNTCSNITCHVHVPHKSNDPSDVLDMACHARAWQQRACTYAVRAHVRTCVEVMFRSLAHDSCSGKPACDQSRQETKRQASSGIGKPKRVPNAVSSHPPDDMAPCAHPLRSRLVCILSCMNVWSKYIAYRWEHAR